MTTRRMFFPTVALPTALFLAALVFYLFTLAPTVLWGDDAWLQRAAQEGVAPPNSPIRWTWLQLARVFVRLPVGDIAFRSNLLSAVAGAATVASTYLAGRSLRLSRAGSVLPALAIAVAHTFWMHAVRAEVYTLFALLFMLELWLWFLWSPGRTAVMTVALALWGVLLLTHPLALLLLPAWAWLLWRRRAEISWTDVIWWPLAFAAGMALFLLVQRAAGGGLAGVLLYLTKSGADVSGALFSFSLAQLPRDLLLWLGMLGLQFAGPALLLIALGLFGDKGWRREANWQALLVLYLTSVLFAFAYRVNDQFVFYLPGYLALVFFAGRGWDAATTRWPGLARRGATAATALLTSVTPPVMYLAAVQLVLALGINPFGVRSLPGREPVSFFLWPGKAGYQGAREYGEAALSSVAPNGVLVADYTPWETLLYLQSVEGQRPDVQILYTGPGVDLKNVLAEGGAGRPVYFADNNPGYYAFETLGGHELVQEGVIYRLASP